MIRAMLLCLTFAVASLAQQSTAQPITLDFLPPTMSPRDICARPATAPLAEDETVGDNPVELTDPDRIRYLRRDIRVHMAEDPIGYFDFIDALITRRGEIDPNFTAVDATFARVDLWLRAGRLSELENAGLIAKLRDRVGELSNNQRVALGRFYTDGVGVARDQAFAQELIREAAYGGNANALFEIVRLAQRNELVEGWDAPLDLTLTMAFGGILGALDSGVCKRAEQIAQAYRKGDVVKANPALALAWTRFAADMGRAEAAWRMVEHHLSAGPGESDNLELRHYLEQAIRLGISLSGAQRASLAASGEMGETELARILGFNHTLEGSRTTASIVPLLQLSVNIDELEPEEDDGLYALYLREIITMPQAPGRAFDQLAHEILVKRGRWAGEAEAMVLLENAYKKGDRDGTRRLAQMLLRYRDDPAQVARAETLLMEVITRHGAAEGMRDLDHLYRCRVNDAPRMQQAQLWAQNYHAADHRNVGINATDLLALAPGRAPETIAKIQTQALAGRSQMVASLAQRLQADPLVSDNALRFWAQAVNRSDQVLEAFAELEFELASTPAQRDQAIEFFRRVYLNNGVTTALDLAIALVEYNARDPEIVEEIVTLLTMAGNRGEGAAIRLLARLQAGVREESDVYAQFADKIEARGDFLALMFAIPHLQDGQVDDYMDRAVSLMSCGTKDVDEVGEAYALRADATQSYRWRRIGVSIDKGNVLSKLRLSDRQMSYFDEGSPVDPTRTASDALEDGTPGALLNLVALTSDPRLETYDAERAATYFARVLQTRDTDTLAQAVELYRKAPEGLRKQVSEEIELPVILQTAAEAGDVASAFQLGMVLRGKASTQDELRVSAGWLLQAAERGHRDAMFEYGYAVGYGLGQDEDPVAALLWLDQADQFGHPQAGELARLMRVRVGP